MKCPIEQDQIRFKSKNNLLEFIEKWKSLGHFKNCAHLDIRENHASTYYPYTCIPICKQNSFKSQTEGYCSSREMFYGCPAECRCYRSQKKNKIIRIKNNILNALSNSFKKLMYQISILLKYLASLHWSVQIFLLIALMVIFSPSISKKIFPSLLQIFNAIHH